MDADAPASPARAHPLVRRRFGRRRADLALLALLRGGPVGLDHPDAVAEVLDLAIVHGVPGRVAGPLLAQPGATGAVRDRLVAVRPAVTAAHLAALATLDRVAAALTGAAVPWLVVKGPVLAELHRSSPDQRSYVDLDVVVPAAGLAAAVAALERSGCRLAARNWPLLVRQAAAELPFTTPEGVVLDLHWHLVNPAALRRRRTVDMAALFAGSRSVDLGGTPARTLDPASTLVHVAMHAADGGPDRYVWLDDLDAAVAAEPPAWPQVVDRARGWRVGAAVGISLGRARRLLGTPVPDAVLHALVPPAWRAVAAAVGRVSPPGAAHPYGSLARSVARASRDSTTEAAAELFRRGLGWVRDGGPLRHDRGSAPWAADDPASAFHSAGPDDPAAVAAALAELARRAS